MKALIPGVGGFVGSHLASYLVGEAGLDVWGLDLVEGRAAALRPRITLHVGDVLMDLPALQDLFAAEQPDYVFHLAAQAFVPSSWKDPWTTLENNIRGQLNVLLAAVAMERVPRILVVGSADEYGIVFPEELPISETNPLRPNSPYAVSKVAQDMMGYQYYASHKLPVVRVRPFNHIGPGQSPAFVTADFAKQIAEVEAGLREPVMRVGNLEARRDFSDVRDIIRGYYLALSEGEPGEVYNLGAERSYSIRQVLDGLLALSETRVTVEQDPTRLRPSDVPEILADCAKFRSRTGWRAEIPLERSLKDILDYWRSRIR
ncbi:MAG: GDP-mannose 4,6-dehydratase [Anaerolineales bacterium]|nr:MAG: GDP-mannose 4,6-dehydratase [Anaerolineales bacterium]